MKIMDLVKIIISFLVLITITCLAGIIIEPSISEKPSIFSKTTANVVNLCYKINLHAVGIAGNSDGLLIRTLHSHEIPTITLVGNTSKRNLEDGHGQRGLPRKLHVFVVTASSATELKDIIKDIRDSRWWNHLASYFIIDSSPESKDGCSNAFEMLWIAWIMDLLNTKFVCANRTMDHLIYAYNPYTRHAPDSWTLENTYKGINDHPFSLFVQRYQESESICKELDFDKTNNLGGYRIYATGMNFGSYCSPDSNVTLANCSDMSIKVINQILSEHLNGIVYDQHHRDFSSTQSNATNEDVLREVESRITDILVDTRFGPTVTNYTTTYPHWHSGLSVLTQRSSKKSSLNKILSLVDSTSRYGFYLVLLITLIYFKFFLRQEFIQVFLNTMLIISYLPLRKLPAKVAPRIYLGSLFIFVLTILAIYQGNLASLLTMPVSFPNVETFKDLVNANYTIYAHKSYDRFFTKTELEERFIGIESYNCTEQVLRDSSAACVRGERRLVPEMIRFNLHMPDREIIALYEVYVIRENWPIEQKVNLLILRMTESGFAQHWNSRQTDVIIDKHYFFEDQLKIKKFRVITLDNIAFAFVTLGVGLICASLAFILEVGMVVN